MSKINILYYEPTSGYGGSSRCLLGWLKKLDHNIFEPVVAVHYDGPVIQQIRETGVPVVTIPFRSRYIYRENMGGGLASYVLALSDLFFFALPSAIYLYNVIKKRHIDIAHLNSKIFGVIPGIIASRLAGSPCLCHCHDVKVPYRKEKYFARWVDHLVVLTKSAQKMYAMEYPGTPQTLIPNGVDLSECRQAGSGAKIKEDFHIGPNDRVAGMVGRLVEGKGFRDLIEAAKLLAPNCPGLKFMIVGDAARGEQEYAIALRELVKKENLGKTVIFTGWREDIREIMNIFDVLAQVSSTFPEGFGMTVVEAMALKKPVVVSNIPGPSELVIDGQTGLVIPPADPAALAKALEKIITDVSLAQRLGENGYQRALKEYNLDVTMNKITSLYKELLIKGGRNVQ